MANPELIDGKPFIRDYNFGRGAYFYDSERTIEEQDTPGNTQATYVYGGRLDEVLTMDRGGQTYYYHENALGSEEAITDSSANPVERYSYDAYGAVTVTDGGGSPVTPNAWGTPHSAIGNPWMFTGRQLDEEAGLYFYRARYYDPSEGRFLSRDRLEAGDGRNLYEYVRSSPTNFTDPTGYATYQRTLWLSLTPMKVKDLLADVITAVVAATRDPLKAQAQQILDSTAAALDTTLERLSPWVAIDVTWQGNCPNIGGARWNWRTTDYQGRRLALGVFGRITTNMISGWEPWPSDTMRKCRECDAPETIQGKAAEFRSEWFGNFNVSGSAGISVIGSGGNVGAGIAADVTISSATGSIEIYADGWSKVQDSLDRHPVTGKYWDWYKSTPVASGPPTR